MRRLFFHAVLVLIFRCLFTFAARLGDFEQHARSSSKKRHSKKKGKHWTYGTPEEWGLQFPDCDGQRQSPINVKMATVMTVPHAATGSLFNHMSYQHVLHHRSIVNTGHTLQVKGHWGRLRLPNGLYYMRHMNFHFPSEHTVDGKELVGEIQLVHERHGSSDLNDVAIVSVLLRRGEQKSKFFSDLGFGHGLPEKGESRKIGTLSLAPIVQLTQADFVHYEGSLTAPPCSEGVRWFVLSETLDLSLEQIKDFHAIFPYPNNARPTQAMGHRVVVENALSLAGLGPPSNPPPGGGIRPLSGPISVLLEEEEQVEIEEAQEDEDEDEEDEKQDDEDEDDENDDDEDDDEDDEAEADGSSYDYAYDYSDAEASKAAMPSSPAQAPSLLQTSVVAPMQTVATPGLQGLPGLTLGGGGGGLFGRGPSMLPMAAAMSPQAASLAAALASAKALSPAAVLPAAAPGALAPAQLQLLLQLQAAAAAGARPLGGGGSSLPGGPAAAIAPAAPAAAASPAAAGDDVQLK